MMIILECSTSKPRDSRANDLAKDLFPVKCRKYAENGELWQNFKRVYPATQQEKN